ncbi:uncharacterized protein KIAA1958-like [Saccostrea cucullata]|uniref:uncharacterized protein KIAA1958-like n=1 Tax=Saccostrea cuccullata TaxID=36930 RepID=UPI002ED01474
MVSPGISMEEDGMDFALSQALDIIEAEESLNELSLTQTVELYEVEPADFGEFSMLQEFDAIIPDDIQENKRFASPVEEEEIDNIKKSYESKNTRKNTNWSVSTFQEWRKNRIQITEASMPELTLTTNETEMNDIMTRFVLESRRKDGAQYPPRSLYQLCVGVLRYLRENGNSLNFLDEKNLNFQGFRRALSAKMSELTAQGVGVIKRQAEPLSEKDEKILWEKNILGNSSSKSLLNSVFFYNCKLFGLRSVDEHRNLSIDQFELHDDGNERPYIIFKGRISKTYKGGLNQRNISPKIIKHMFCDDELYNVYKEYVCLILSLDSDPTAPFYRRALDGRKFSKQCIGVNRLSTMMKSMCQEGGLEGNCTNHSGKRTCATALYQAGIEEQEIMARTGQRSIESVRQYKRASDEIVMEVSNVLEPKRIKIKSEEATSTISASASPDPPPSMDTDVPGPIFTHCTFNFGGF